jgi:hypothetical protein
MAEVDRRQTMSVAEFDAIPEYENDPIDGYYEVLIDGNERISHEFYERIERLQELTAGQRMLIQLGTFDSQVKNGGITQFFWNHTESIFDVADWIEQLGVGELHANYERALEVLVGAKDRWLALREEWGRGGTAPDWETFRHSYELLDLGWFDKAYFDGRAYNERKELVLQSRGLHYALLSRIAEYIRHHRAEFITE